MPKAPVLASRRTPGFPGGFCSTRSLAALLFALCLAAAAAPAAFADAGDAADPTVWHHEGPFGGDQPDEPDDASGQSAPPSLPP